jgi:putative RNA 2'-phosphotransferase
MSPSLVRQSKFLSLVLRHDPARIGLRLDEAGWADVDELLARAGEAGMPLTWASLREVVEQNDKQRFAFSPDGRRIRANQGHSLPVDLQLAPVSPPERLFHGTATRFLAAIREQGLTAQRRQHVHLSADPATAVAVGRRHGAPVVLTIEAGRMAVDGYRFVRSANWVWLTDVVPAPYIVFPHRIEET